MNVKEEKERIILGLRSNELPWCPFLDASEINHNILVYLNDYYMREKENK